MLLILANEENPMFKKLHDNIQGSTGIFLFDEESGGIAVLTEKGKGYEITDISEVVRKDAPTGPTLRAIKPE